VSFWNGERIKQVRAVLEISQGEFAAAIGTRQQTVSEWETGHSRPSPAYCQVLSLKVERLFEQRGVRNGGDISALNAE
jgi:DNA-binding transcriptional regulator YiaG